MNHTSRSQLRRGAALVTVLALSAGALVAPMPAMAVEPAPRPLIVVGLGDSYAAGEGLGPDYGLVPDPLRTWFPVSSTQAATSADLDPSWARQFCQRSSQAWGPMAASRLPAGSEFTFAACTGATTGAVAAEAGTATASGEPVEYQNARGSCDEDDAVDHAVECVASKLVGAGPNAAGTPGDQVDLVAAYREGRPSIGFADAVTIAAGINDLGFAGEVGGCITGYAKNFLARTILGTVRGKTVTTILSKPTSWPRWLLLAAVFSYVKLELNGNEVCPSSEVSVRADIERRIDGMSERLVATYHRAAKLLRPGGTLVVAGYPRLVADPDTWPAWTLRRCGVLSPADATRLRDFGDRLNDEVRQAVEEFRRTNDGDFDAEYIDAATRFDGHEQCGPRGEWLYGMRSVAGGVLNGGGCAVEAFRFERAFHPTCTGHGAVAPLVWAALSKVDGTGTTQPAPAASPPQAPTPRPAPPTAPPPGPPTAPSTPALAEPPPDVWTSAPRMPDVRCTNLQAAQDLIQTTGVFFARSHDATGAGRRQIFDANWVVVGQTPSTGEPLREGAADLAVVKNEELDQWNLDNPSLACIYGGRL